MSLSFTSLGFADSTGKEAIDQAIAFKRQLRAQLPFPDGVSPMISPDPDTRRCEVRVAYDRSFPRAEAWTERAAELAEGIWEKVQHGNKEKVRT